MIFFLFIALTIATLFVIDRLVSKFGQPTARTNYDYDAIIVGGSISGPAMAKAMSDQGRKVLLLDRTLFTKPRRIVGELLQPGGINFLRSLGMETCATSIGMPCHGYIVVDEKGEKVDLPYSGGNKGVSFHFGDFVTNLRHFVWKNCSVNVTMLEGTVVNVLTEGSLFSKRAYGVEYTIAENYAVPEFPFEKDPVRDFNTPVKRVMATAPLIIMCDGGMSVFKSRFQHYTPAPTYHSNFVGLIVKKVRLPVEERGTVFFGKTGPILSYRLDSNELRFLVDYNKPKLPSIDQQKTWLLDEIAPQLPENMRADFVEAASDIANIHSMPVARYPPAFPRLRSYIGVGDHSNQRHPLTGGGMTCCFGDAVRLAEKLKPLKSLRSTNITEASIIDDSIQDAILSYTRSRFRHSCCINILSWALYGVFSIPELRSACFDYFVLGGDCVSGPMNLLAGLEPKTWTLFIHYYRVMLNGAYNKLTLSGAYTNRGTPTPSFQKKILNFLTFFVNPARMAEAIFILWRSTVLIAPLVIMEFISAWRLADPTCFLANIAREIKVVIYRNFLNGTQGKPVGI